MEDLLPAIEVETHDSPEFSVIWLHGLGADGSDFVPVVPELGLDDLPGVRFIFPHAPVIPVTCNGGYAMRAWYDIISLESNDRRVDEAGIVASVQAVGRLIARENQRGIASDRIFLAGFSQGGAIAYMTALSYPEKLAGVIALSTYIPNRARLAEEATAANKAIPVFAAHGREDQVLAIGLGRAARDFLVQNGYRVQWLEYYMPHSVCPEEIDAIATWLSARIAER